MLGIVWDSTTTSAQAQSEQERESERQAEFVEALRQRGWYDTALEYLNNYAADDPLITETFRRLLPYEQGRTLTEQAKHSTNIHKRAARQQQAVQQFLEFADAHPKQPESLDALRRAGNLLATEALQTIARLQKLPEQDGAEHKRLSTDLQRLLDRAETVLRDLKKTCEDRLAALPKPAVALRDPSIAKQRDHLRARRAEARFLLGKVAFDKAQAFEEGSEAYQQTLTEAAVRFEKLAQDNSDNLTGFYGRLYEGRCYQALGLRKRALASYEELVVQPIQNPVFRQLVARAFRRRAECFLRMENYDQAIEECQRWLDLSRSNELDRGEWLALKYQLAQVLLKKSELLSEPDSQLTIKARRLLTDVSQHTGEFQGAARVALTTLIGPSAGDDPPDRVSTKAEEVKKFQVAVTAGKEAIERMNAFKLAARVAKNNNPEGVESLQQQAELAQLQARQLFERALELADPKSAQDPLDAIRYYLCWLDWEDGQLQRAAILGEFLAVNYPESRYTPDAAKVALAAYERLYNQSLATRRERAEDDHDGNQGQVNDFGYEAKRLATLAELVVLRWPDSPEATAASQLLINMAVRDRRFEEAEAMLERLPESNRAAGQLSLGSALWTTYLQALQRPSDQPDPQALQRCQRAKILLQQGLKRVSSLSQLTPAQAKGALTLAQLLLHQGDVRQSLEVLEDSRIGPLVLLQERSVAKSGQLGFPEGFPDRHFAEKAFKTALRVYVSVSPPQREQALAMMDALEQMVAQGGDEDDKRQLTRVYVSLGLQLQKQVHQLTATGKSEEAGRVAAAFEEFLERVGERADAGDWSIQLWIAQTNQQLGAGLLAGNRVSDSGAQDTAQHYFEQALRAYQSLLEKAAKEPDFAPSPSDLLRVKMRLSDCQSRLGMYDDAIKGYTSVLRKKPNWPELQRAAALALQEWGAHARRIESIDQSIRGAMPQADQKNLIWGWVRLATIADYARGKERAIEKRLQASDPNKKQTQLKMAKYKDYFFEARYHVIQARFQAAQFSQGAARQKYLRTARQGIQSMVKLYPDLGGDHWKGSYEQLQAEIEALE